MSICEVCGKDRSTSSSCIKLLVQLNGRDYEPIPWGKGKNEIKDKCPGCGVSKDGYHHPGCDYEQCPCCGKTIISCNCDQT
ncbi:MAG: hypothetical protein ACM3NT_10235 [Methylocystaceae bacterium]